MLRYVSVDLAQRIARMNEMMDAFEEAWRVPRLSGEAELLPSGVDEVEEQRAAEQRAAEAARTAEAEAEDEAEKAALSFADGAGAG